LYGSRERDSFSDHLTLPLPLLRWLELQLVLLLLKLHLITKAEDRDITKHLHRKNLTWINWRESTIN
jgi:hypothetical protein